MRVLVTGGAGYIGSILCESLIQNGFKVRILDRFFFGKESIKNIENHPDVEIVNDDIRYCESSVMKDIDAVIDLAALSNDPSGELDPEKTMAINFKGRERIANLAKSHGVGRYILVSSCSIYGFQDGWLDESSKTNPLTVYAKANLMAENANLAISDKKFSVTCLRLATVYGLSHKMRFDLAINGMVLGLFKNKKIPILRDGKQFRPFIHVRDASRAFISTLEADTALINGQIFNVGSNEQNYMIFDLAKAVADAVDLSFEYEWYGSPDNRSYRVKFDKVNKIGFKTKFASKDGAKEIYNALVSGKVTDGLKTITVKWYKHLIEAGVKI